jgi:WD40 repeat protein
VIGDSGSGKIEYFDNDTFNRISPNSHTNKIWHLKYLPFNNGCVASASHDHTVNIWNTLTWKSIQKYKNHSDFVFTLDQIDNDTMVSGSSDQTIRIWKISTGETLKTINVKGWVLVVRVFSNEYKMIVCGKGGSSNNLQIYNYETGDFIRTSLVTLLLFDQ